MGCIYSIFSFDLVHKPGKNFTIPDGLSRRPPSEDEEKEKSDFDEEEELIKQHPGFGVEHNNIKQLAGIKLPSKQEGFQFGQKAVLPIDIEARTYLEIEWQKVQSSEYLLEARAEQLSVKEEMRKRAKEKLKKAREDSVKYGDRKLAHQIRNLLHPGQIFLVYNKALESQCGSLLKNRWDGPCRAVRQINNGPYEVEELDGTKLARRLSESQIKKFYPRGKEEAEYEEDFDE
ncbi:hypothetical protein O181_095991 [Austropuccinia psidii MF-1]|uniref:Uncharacterized protein n=1 Tax=Austropuccinia psidii MF-1 TaxID=1389203 RepID=A0A9Q3J6J7_9BASI|nr:hypothetical protein [Austropuccinia psidii MF-1]